MNETFINIVLSSGITLVAYLIGLKLFQASNRKVWLNPLYTVTLLLFICLPLLHFDYKAYESGSTLFSFLMQTAIVSLAIPLFKQWQLIKKHFKKIGTGISVGCAAGFSSTYALSSLFGIKKDILASLLPKAATLPVALSAAGSIGGVPSLTVLFVLTSALFSFICGPRVLEWLNITSKAAKGLAMGASAQALGASKCLQWGEEEGAMSAVAMTTTALIVSSSIPVYAYLL
jgi:putative effector of murein hydrolase